MPHQTHVYKILSADKNNFSYKILNLQTGSTRQVNHSLLERLNLDKLTEISFYTPTLFDGLVKLSNMARNKYVPGRKDNGLHLLQPQEQGLAEPDPEEAQEHQGLDGLDPEEAQEITDLGAQELTNMGAQNEHFITDEKTVTEKDNGLEEPGRQIVTDSDDGLDNGEITESAGNPANEPGDDSMEKHGDGTHTHTGLSTAPPRNRRYNTRFKGERHVPIYTSQLSNISRQVATRSILKISKDFPYNFKQNFNPQELRKVDYPLFVTRRKALKLHKEVCADNLCRTCELCDKIATFTFNQLDFTRYKDQADIPAPAGQNSKKLPSRVRFTVIETPGKSKHKPVVVNSTTFMAALKSNVSISETKLLLDF